VCASSQIVTCRDDATGRRWKMVEAVTGDAQSACTQRGSCTHLPVDILEIVDVLDESAISGEDDFAHAALRRAESRLAAQSVYRAHLKWQSRQNARSRHVEDGTDAR
jgi:hypothetical protein